MKPMTDEEMDAAMAAQQSKPLSDEEMDALLTAPAPEKVKQPAKEQPKKGVLENFLGNIKGMYGVTQDASDALRQGAEEITAGGLAGAATIPIAGAKLTRLLNPFDSVSRETGTERGMQEFRDKYKDSGLFTTGDIAAKVAGTAGVGSGMGNVVSAISQSPKALAIAEALRTAGLGAQTAGVPTRMAAGSAVGGASDLMTGGNGVSGAVIGGALPAAQAVATPAISKIYDLLSGQSVNVRGGKVMRDVAGDKIEKIKEALLKNTDDVSAAQAAEPAGSTRFSALGKRAERANSEYFNELGNIQEAKRLSSLEAVMPDLNESEKARKAISEINYGKAFQADAQRRAVEQQAEQSARSVSSGGISGFSPKPAQPVPAVMKMAGNPIIASAAKEATILAKSQGRNIGNPMTSLEGLHYMKMAIDNQFKNKTATTALQNYSDEALRNTKQSLLNIIEGDGGTEGISPLYKLAREQHTELSQPVNQAKVIQAMVDVMKKSTGGERVTPFLDVMGRGENALLKRADQSARFGGIEDVLTKGQMEARNKVASEMIRDVNVDSLASKGVEDLAGVLRKDAFHTTIPNYISWKLSAAKRGLDIAEEHLNEKTMKRIYEAMKTPKGALELINTLPANERVQAIKLLKNMSNPAITPALTVDKDSN